jgi:hypothetical protein
VIVGARGALRARVRGWSSPSLKASAMPGDRVPRCISVETWRNVCRLAYSPRTMRRSAPPEVALWAFFEEHRRCGELEAGVDDRWAWMTCECGASMAHEVTRVPTDQD